MKKNSNRAMLELAFAMLIYGTIGLFRRNIALSSAAIAMARGFIGSLFLLLFLRLRHKPFDMAGVRPKLHVVLISGLLIGFNWIFLFEAYNETTVATATLCYYMAPIIVLLFSPVVLGESMTAKKLICIGIAVLGMVLISGVNLDADPGKNRIRGIFFGLAAAVLYASVIMLNKKMTEVPVYERTILQLAAAALVTLPYQIATDGIGIQTDIQSILLLVFLGIVHTGIAYVLYFGSITRLPAHTVAMFSYIDPVTAVIWSATLLHEPMTFTTMIGMILILGATLVSEWTPSTKKEKQID